MRRLTTEEFVRKANTKHNNLYDYSLVIYINSRSKVKIICPIHGMFEQEANSHLQGEGCSQCVECKKLDTNTFIKKASIKHKCIYNYSLVKYHNNKSKVKIICPIHGMFEQNAGSHLRGVGCPSCAGLKRKENIYFLENLTIEEAPIETDNEVRCVCSYCKKYFTPTRRQLKHRISSLSGKLQGESRLYCSDKCKDKCPIYHRKVFPKGFVVDISRPIQPELKQLTLERDNNQCQRCGSSDDLHCHHITGVEINPVESADIDNCITLCDRCHDKAHSESGCHYSDMRRQPCVV